jgi:hypothetical protein
MWWFYEKEVKEKLSLTCPSSTSLTASPVLAWNLAPQSSASFIGLRFYE